MLSAARQYLVCVRIGNDSAFEAWFRPEQPRSWDLFLSYYRAPEGPLRHHAEFVSHGGLSKFSAVKRLCEEHPHLFQRYFAIWIVDDDIDIDFASVDRLFTEMTQFGLALVQPSLSRDSYFYWKITLNEPESRLRYTDFVEVMMPAFSQAAFQQCVGTFDQSISSWGLDFAWPKLLGYPPHRIGILDSIVARHTKKLDTKEGPFYKYLASIGVDPAKELNRVVKTYGLSGNLSARVVARVPADRSSPTQTTAAPQPNALGNAPAPAPARPATPESDLVLLAIKHRVDKWGEHWYALHYDRHFSPFRHRPINLLEIGIGGYENPSGGGQSLRMWDEYFSSALIYGIDIYDKSPHAQGRIRTRQGSQDDPGFLRKVAGEVDAGFDIVIDDGSHVNQHVITSFATLFPLLNDGGLYAIEDLQTSYWPGFGGSSDDLNTPSSALGFFKHLIDSLNYEEIIRPEYEPSYFDKHVVGLHFYHNLLIIEKGLNREGSNRLKNNVPITTEPEICPFPVALSDDFDAAAYLRLKG